MVARLVWKGGNGWTDGWMDRRMDRQITELPKPMAVSHRLQTVINCKQLSTKNKYVWNQIRILDLDHLEINI